MQESGGSQNVEKTIFYEGRCALLCCMCLFYQDYNHLVRFHLKKNILLCYPSMNVMIVVSSWKDDHL